jgi:hypothetical protein
MHFDIQYLIFSIFHTLYLFYFKIFIYQKKSDLSPFDLNDGDLRFHVHKEPFEVQLESHVS